MTNSSIPNFSTVAFTATILIFLLILASCCKKGIEGSGNGFTNTGTPQIVKATIRRDGNDPLLTVIYTLDNEGPGHTCKLTDLSPILYSFEPTPSDATYSAGNSYFVWKTTVTFDGLYSALNSEKGYQFSFSVGNGEYVSGTADVVGLRNLRITNSSNSQFLNGETLNNGYVETTTAGLGMSGINWQISYDSTFKGYQIACLGDGISSKYYLLKGNTANPTVSLGTCPGDCSADSCNFFYWSLIKNSDQNTYRIKNLGTSSFLQVDSYSTVSLNDDSSNPQCQWVLNYYN